MRKLILAMSTCLITACIATTATASVGKRHPHAHHVHHIVQSTSVAPKVVQSASDSGCDFSGFRTGSEDLPIPPCAHSNAGGQVHTNRFFPNYSPE